MAKMGLKKLVKLRGTLSAFPETTFGGEGVLSDLTKKIHKTSDRLVNARGKGVRFIKKGGRIIPIMPKKGV